MAKLLIERLGPSYLPAIELASRQGAAFKMSCELGLSKTTRSKKNSPDADKVAGQTFLTFIVATFNIFDKADLDQIEQV